jgi:hypothetical protein
MMAEMNHTSPKTWPGDWPAASVGRFSARDERHEASTAVGFGLRPRSATTSRQSGGVATVERLEAELALLRARKVE